MSDRHGTHKSADLLATTIHLHSQCDDDLQTSIADHLETLPDDDEH